MPMILNATLPHDPFDRRRLPGVGPLREPWLFTSDTHAAQMAERERLIRTRRDDVIWAAPDVQDALAELLDTVLAALPPGYSLSGDWVTRPDGQRVTLDPTDPLATLGVLVQEDFCLLVKAGAEHVLAAAVLCFPSSWRLDEKAGRGLVSIHDPVPEYDVDVGRRVQRLFDGVQPGRPLTRYNLIWSAVPTLFNPRSEHDRRREVETDTLPFLRTERQCILRLPRTRSVVFSIHTFMMPRADAQALRAI
jgi:hypothetical protein